jgi:hypothetical protein
LLFNHPTDAVGVVGFIGQHDGARPKVVEQGVGSLLVMRLPSCQAEPDREALRVNDRVDLGCEPASGATETVISIPLFAVAACWWARTDVLSIIQMPPSWAVVIAPIIRSQTPAFRHRK